MLADWLLSDVQALLSGSCRLPLLHVGGEVSAAGLLKQMCRKLQERSVLQSTAVVSANVCINVTIGILQINVEIMLYATSCVHTMWSDAVLRSLEA